ncbi:hypothetical protein ACCI51_06345 [Microbulbifer echini]|uniref:Spore coat protein U domain-containing protein n=1 Tax=Microbulbifer echini TaxID=1529067 RepID=A0ABV4NMA2_9GAMM|nr:hypothetical protein [uncultured Microbulbifer sp.]
MRNVKDLLGKLLWLSLLFLSCYTPAQAQSCSSNDSLRTCNLGGTHSLNYQPNTKEIAFTLRSRSAFSGRAFSYYAELAPLSGNSFTLTADNGDILDISFTLDPSNSDAQSLTLNTLAGPFNGSRNDTNASLLVEIDNAKTPSSNQYTGSFQLTLEQYFLVFVTDSETVDFDIILEVEPNITIRHLGDVDLSNSGISFGQAIEGHEDFCIGGIGFDRYKVNLSSGNGSTGGTGTHPFALRGASESIPYSISFSDNLNSNNSSFPGSQGDIAGSFIRRTDESCINENARVYITVAPSDWEQAGEPIYTDVLTITVSSQ